MRMINRVMENHPDAVRNRKGVGGQRALYAGGADIGGYTTDVLLLKNGKTDLQFCRSLETGIITMNRVRVKAAIYMRFGNEPQKDEERSCGYTRKISSKLSLKFS